MLQSTSYTIDAWSINRSIFCMTSLRELKKACVEARRIR